MIANRNDARVGAVQSEPSAVPPIIGYARAMRSHLGVCVAVILAAVGGAAGWMGTHPPEYESTTQLLVTPLPDGDSSFLGVPMIRSQGADPQRAVTTAAALAESGEILRLASEQLGGELSPDEIERAVEITPIEGENIVEITATATDAKQAAAIADAYVESVLVARQAELRPLIADAIRRAEAELAKLADREGLRANELEARLADLRSVDDGADPTLTVALVASVPTTPEGLPRWMILVIALAAGTALAAVTAILIELLAPGSVDNEDDLRRAYPLPILARVPRGSRRPPRSRPSLELSPQTREAFRGLRAQLELRRSDHPSDQARASRAGRLTGVVVITSPMTGDGKTSAALALGQVTAATGADVVILETDLRKPELAARLGIEPDRELIAILGASSLQAVATPLPGADGLKFVAAPRIDDMSMIERVGALVPSLLNRVANDDVCVIVDTAALGEVSDALPILPAADHVVVAVRMHRTTHAALLSLRDSLERAGVRPAGFVVFDSPAAGGSPASALARRTRGRQA